MGFSVIVVDDCRHSCWWLGLWLSFVCLSRGCFVSALRLPGSIADPGTGMSESARCALGRQKARRPRRLLLSTGAICVLVRMCVRVSLVFRPVGKSARGCGRDVWLFEVGVGAGTELRRRSRCPSGFAVGRVSCSGCYCVLPRTLVPRVSTIRWHSCFLSHFCAFRVLSV